MSAISHATRRKCVISRASRKEGYCGRHVTPRYSEPTPQRGAQPHTLWTDEEVKALFEMREPRPHGRGMQWSAIAKELGRTEGQCTARYHYGRPHHNATYAAANHKCSDAQLAERESAEELRIRRVEEAEATGRLTAVILGDPLPGRSALDLCGKDKPYIPSLPKISARIVWTDTREAAR